MKGDIDRRSQSRERRLDDRETSPGRNTETIIRDPRNGRGPMAGSRGHAYVWDGERRFAPPIHRRWYGESGIAELNERLRAPPVALRFRGMAADLPPNRRSRLPPASVALTREVMALLFARAEPLVARH